MWVVVSSLTSISLITHTHIHTCTHTTYRLLPTDARWRDERSRRHAPRLHHRRRPAPPRSRTGLWWSSVGLVAMVVSTSSTLNDHTNHRYPGDGARRRLAGPCHPAGMCESLNEWCGRAPNNMNAEGAFGLLHEPFVSLALVRRSSSGRSVALWAWRRSWPPRAQRGRRRPPLLLGPRYVVWRFDPILFQPCYQAKLSDARLMSLPRRSNPRHCRPRASRSSPTVPPPRSVYVGK
jgi:hypothetical protein